ncbi:MAG: MFS transporter [Chloroflexota bacterium]
MLLTRALRTFAYGYLGVVLGAYLDQLGLDPFLIGIVLTSAVVGSAVMTVVWSLLADRVGRRRTVAIMAGLMTAGGLLFALTDQFALLLVGAFTGTISVTSSEFGVFQTVEQAILPQTAPSERRTWIFSIYNFTANIAQAVGSLFAASVGVFAGLGLSGPDAYRPLFVLYALIGLANLAIFASLSERVELARVEGERRLFGIHRSRGMVARLSALFAFDSFAGGFVVYSVVAYWFYLRWGFEPGALAVLFFAVNVLSGLSLLVAGWLAGRIGLLNTMVFTHLPSNVLLMLVPFMPTPGLAVAVYLARMSLSQMDVPTRQSYVMAVVAPDERTATAGITNLARISGTAASPALAGLAFSLAALGLPFVVSGALKIPYDLLLYRTFRHIRPPEEEARRIAAAAAVAVPTTD